MAKHVSHTSISRLEKKYLSAMASADAASPEPSSSSSSSSSTPSWLPLESNPDVLNPFVKRLGLPDGYGF